MIIDVKPEGSILPKKVVIRSHCIIKDAGLHARRTGKHFTVGYNLLESCKSRKMWPASFVFTRSRKSLCIASLVFLLPSLSPLALGTRLLAAVVDRRAISDSNSAT